VQEEGGHRRVRLLLYFSLLAFYLPSLYLHCSLTSKGTSGLLFFFFCSLLCVPSRRSVPLLLLLLLTLLLPTTITPTSIANPRAFTVSVSSGPTDKKRVCVCVWHKSH
jgi:hypothetical protein